jgi:oligosaccharyltransferase complex subunit alpha (ribophorin I)
MIRKDICEVTCVIIIICRNRGCYNVKTKVLTFVFQDEAKESKMRVASLVEEVQSAQDKRSALYQSYDDAIDKFKAGKDHSNFMSQRKKIDGDYKQLTSQIQNLQGQLKSEGSDLGEKV